MDMGLAATRPAADSQTNIRTGSKYDLNGNLIDI